MNSTIDLVTMTMNTTTVVGINSSTVSVIVGVNSSTIFFGGNGSTCSMLSDSFSTMNVSKTALKRFSKSYGAIHGYVSIFICLFGMLANSANIVVLTRKNMESSTNIILTWLAVADLLTMIDYFPFAMHFYIFKEPDLDYLLTYGKGWAIFLVFHANFSIVCHTIAIWLTIVLAIFRFVIIWYPTKGGIYCNQRRAKQTVFGVILYTVVLCIPNYLSNKIQEFNCNAEPYYQVVIRSEMLSKINYWVQALMFKLIPCFMLTLLTLLLIFAMHRAHKRRMVLKNQGKKAESDKHGEHNRTTFMLLAVVVLFLITELPQGILTILNSSINNFYYDIYQPLGDLMDIVALCNNAINFVLYCTMSRQFRKTFLEIFCSCINERRKGWRKLGVVTAQKNGCSNSSNIANQSNTTKV